MTRRVGARAIADGRGSARRTRALAAVAVLAAAGGLAALARRERGASLPIEGGRRVELGEAPPGDLSGAAPLPDRSRERTAVGSGHVVAPRWEPAALTALARWVPAAPSTPLGRALARVWAAPLTAAGLALAAASAAVPRRRGEVWVAAPARGLFAARFARRGFVACTLGHVIVAAREPADGLLAHELVHVRQAERLGPVMAPLYLGLMGVYGYARHPLERAARAGARRGA